MAIASVGYDGTVDEVQWASMVSKVGGYEYGVDGAGHFAVTQSAGTRMISIAAGLAWGRGIMDISDAAAVIQLDSVSTGSRYDLIALRRSWGPANGGPTELVVVKGTSAKALPSGRQANPGVADDQPLALVRVQAGSASIPEIVDLRVWGRNGGQMYAKDDLVRSYINSVGTAININGMQWYRTVDANNTAQWVKNGPISNTDWASISNTAASGWKIESTRYKSRNGVTQLQITFERTGATIAGSASGDITNVKICTVGSGARPGTWAPMQTGTTGRLVAATVNSAGEVYLTATTGDSIAKGARFQVSGTFLTD